MTTTSKEINDHITELMDSKNVTFKKEKIESIIHILENSLVELNTHLNKVEDSTQLLRYFELVVPEIHTQRSLFQLFLRETGRHYPALLHPMVSVFYHLWELSIFNPSNKSNSNEFPFERFGISGLKVPFTTSSEAKDFTLPLYKSALKLLSDIYLGSALLFDGPHRVQLFEQRSEKLNCEEDYKEVIDEDDESRSVLEYNEEEDTFYRRIYEIPQHFGFDLYSPTVVVSNYTQMPTIESICFKKTKEITAVPAFLLYVIKKYNASEGNELTLLHQLGLEEREIQLSQTLSSYNNLEFLQRSSLSSYFSRTFTFPKPSNVSALIFEGAFEKTNLSFGLLNFISKMREVLKMQNLPKSFLEKLKSQFTAKVDENSYPEIDEFLLVLELISFNFYGIYALAQLTAKQKAIIPILKSDFSNINVPYQIEQNQ